MSKLSNSGSLTWIQLIRGGYIGDVTQTSSGDLLLLGTFFGKAEFPGTNLVSSNLTQTIGFVASMDSEGNLVSARTCGSSFQAGFWFNSVEVDETGAILLSGRHGGGYQLGNHVVLDFSGLFGGPSDSWFIAKLDPSLQVQWVNDYYDSYYGSGSSIARVTPDGAYFSATRTQRQDGSVQMKVERLRPESGVSEWEIPTVGGSVYPTSVQWSPTAGALFISGQSQGNWKFGSATVQGGSSGYSDAFLLRLSATGRVDQLKVLTNGGSCFVNVDSTGISVCGVARGTVSVDDYAFARTDLGSYLCAFDLNCNPLWGSFISSFGLGPQSLVRSGGSTFVVGGFAGSLQVGSDLLTAAGDGDGFVMRFEEPEPRLDVGGTEQVVIRWRNRSRIFSLEQSPDLRNFAGVGALTSSNAFSEATVSPSMPRLFFRLRALDQ